MSKTVKYLKLVIHQQMHYLLHLTLHKKFHEDCSYMFRSSTNLRELVWSLVKVTLYFVRLCGAVAACLESDMCVVCCAEWDCVRVRFGE
jgi:hypothetical protein